MLPSVDEIIDDVRQHPQLVVADDFEILIQNESYLRRRFCNGELASNLAGDSCHIGLRVVHRKRPGRSSCIWSGKQSIKLLVEQAFLSAEHSDVDPWYRFPIWKQVKDEAKPAVEISTSSELASLSNPPDFFEEIIEQISQTIRLVRKTERFSLNSSHSATCRHSRLVNESSGGVYSMLFEDSSHELDPKRWVNRLHDFQRMMAGQTLDTRVEAKTVIGSSVIAHFLSLLTPWFSSELVKTSRSPLSERREGKLISDRLVLTDAAEAGLPFYRPFDDEGVAIQSTTLFEKGELRSLLYDTYNGARDNRASTGNFFRQRGQPFPSIQARHLKLCGVGPVDPAHLIAEMNRGFHLTHLRPGSAFIDKESFCASLSGWYIEDGNRATALREVPVNIDVFQLLSAVAAVGNDVMSHSGCSAPSILFENIPLGR